MTLGSIGYVENKRPTHTQRYTFEKVVPKEEPLVFNNPVSEETLPMEEAKEEELPIFEEYRNITEHSNRYKVVEIIPLDTHEEPKESAETDFMVNDFNDNDYIGFEDAFNASNGGN